MTEMNEKFMRRAIELAREGVEKGFGGPFGCIVVRDGQIVGEGNNRVTSTNDPTAHAEVIAIRDACSRLDSFQLDGCDIYTSCEPCPMCLGAVYWSRADHLYYAGTREDAAAAGFDDQFIYNELERPLGDRRLRMDEMLRDDACKLFREWTEKSDKIEY